MIATIHQPEYLPWLGFFDKARQADLLILLDSVPFRKNYFQNRNRIRSNQGLVWLTVPVFTKGRSDQSISDVKINNEGAPRWREKSWESMRQNYGSTPYFSIHGPFFRRFYEKRWEDLSPMNEAAIHYLLSVLGIETKVLLASSLDVTGQKGDLLLRLCLKVGADTYLSGISGRDYLDVDAFSKAGVAVQFQEFHHPVYTQRRDPFIPCLSAVDLLFHHGPASRNILEGTGVPILDQVFK